jgi:O-antigen ligase
MDEFSPKHQVTSFEYLVHNRYLLTLAETGIVGLIAFAWSLAVVVARALVLARHSVVGVALLGSMVVALLHMNMEAYAAGSFTLWNVWTIAAFVAAMYGAREHVAPDLVFASRDMVRRVARGTVV